MASIDEIDDRYILESYIAESHAIEATISDVGVSKKDSYSIFNWRYLI